MTLTAANSYSGGFLVPGRSLGDLSVGSVTCNAGVTSLSNWVA